MSEQPQDDDHKLNVRLAGLCGMRIDEDPDAHADDYPRVVVYAAYPDLLFLETERGQSYECDVLWNPLEDERQAFRFVVKAMGERECCLELEVGCASDVVAWWYREGTPIAGKAGSFKDGVARPICLAALEAAEKLGSTCTCGQPTTRKHRCPSLFPAEKLEERDGSR